MAARLDRGAAHRPVGAAVATGDARWRAARGGRLPKRGAREHAAPPAVPAQLLPARAGAARGSAGSCRRGVPVSGEAERPGACEPARRRTPVARNRMDAGAPTDPVPDEDAGGEQSIAHGGGGRSRRGSATRARGRPGGWRASRASCRGPGTAGAFLRPGPRPRPPARRARRAGRGSRARRSTGAGRGRRPRIASRTIAGHGGERGGVAFGAACAGTG